jgi:fatty acid desaturase
MLTLLCEWSIIAGAITLGVHFPHPLVYALVWILIGTRMYALYSLLHDGIHFLLLPDRQANDILCRLLLAWPLFIDLDRMRRAHMAHHRHLRTPDDPELAHLDYREFHFPRPASAVALTFLLDMTGVNFIKYKIMSLYRATKKTRLTNPKLESQPKAYFSAKILYYAIIFTLVVYMGWIIPFLMYWILPYITIYQALNRLRLTTEHFHLGDDAAYQTRTVKLNPIEEFFLSPHHLGFHTEHHIYPGVPFYRLPALHRMLMDNDEYRRQALVSRSYIEVLKQYTN